MPSPVKELIMWKPIPDRENYEINDKGQVRRADNKSLRKASRMTRGYWFIKLSSGYQESIHRIMARVFLNKGKPFPEDSYVRFKDRDKDNLSLDNLQIVQRHAPRTLQGKYIYNGMAMSVYEWSKKLDIPASTLYSRLKRGMPFKDAVQ